MAFCCLIESDWQCKDTNFVEYEDNRDCKN
nr:MAG TPA: hypothetical protein [Caudoviricetes sp.]